MFIPANDMIIWWHGLWICVYYIPVRMHEMTIQENDLLIRAHDIIILVHDIIIRLHDIIFHGHEIIFRAHEIINWVFNLIIRANGIRIHTLDIINRMHEIIIRFHEIIILAHNWTIYVNWVVFSSDIITNEPNGHESLTWVYVFLYMYLLETGKALCWHTRIFDRSHSLIGHLLPKILEF